MAFTLITVTRTYKTPAGYPARGTVRFTLISPMVNAGVTAVVRAEEATLDRLGVLSISLYANTDPGTAPAGTYYTVAEEITGQPARTYSVAVPHNAGGTVDLGTLGTLAPAPAVVQYLTKAQADSLYAAGAGGSGTLPSTMLNRVVAVNGVYPTRPSTGYTDFLGIADPASVMQTGDTWTQLPATVPNAPTIGAATGGSTQASVAFTAPAWNGGATITSYTATSTPGGLTASGSSSPLTVTGLTNGTSYTFRVKATNSVGTGPDSAASNSVTPASGTTVPGAPTIGTATAGDASATVAFTPPASNGGATITSYTATSSPGTITGSGASSPVTVSGLTNGTPYTFTVKATNSVGTGSASAASNSVTPAASGSSVTEDFTGTDGAAWSTSRWKAAAGDTGITTFDIQSNQGRVLMASAGAFESVGRKFNVTDSANWRIRGNLAQIPTVAGWSVRVQFQATSWADSLATSTAGYFLDMQGGGTAITKRDDFSTLLNFTGPTGARWFDVKVVGGAISYKLWTGLLSDAPASYTSVSNPAPVTGTGAAGFAFLAGNTAGSLDFRLDDILFDANPS